MISLIKKIIGEKKKNAQSCQIREEQLLGTLFKKNFFSATQSKIAKDLSFFFNFENSLTIIWQNSGMKEKIYLIYFQRYLTAMTSHPKMIWII